MLLPPTHIHCKELQHYALSIEIWYLHHNLLSRNSMHPNRTMNPHLIT